MIRSEYKGNHCKVEIEGDDLTLALELVELCMQLAKIDVEIIRGAAILIQTEIDGGP